MLRSIFNGVFGRTLLLPENVFFGMILEKEDGNGGEEKGYTSTWDLCIFLVYTITFFIVKDCIFG